MFFSSNAVIIATFPILGWILASSRYKLCSIPNIIEVIYATCFMGAVRIDKYKTENTTPIMNIRYG
jgi:hypothetical protein